MRFASLEQKSALLPANQPISGCPFLGASSSRYLDPVDSPQRPYIVRSHLEFHFRFLELTYLSAGLSVHIRKYLASKQHTQGFHTKISASSGDRNSH